MRLSEEYRQTTDLHPQPQSRNPPSLEICNYCVFVGVNAKTKYRLGTVNWKSFVGKDFLWIKLKYELTVHFKHEMIAKHSKETLNKVELRINRVRINRTRPVAARRERGKGNQQTRLEIIIIIKVEIFQSLLRICGPWSIWASDKKINWPGWKITGPDF